MKASNLKEYEVWYNNICKGNSCSKGMPYLRRYFIILHYLMSVTLPERNFSFEAEVMWGGGGGSCVAPGGYKKMSSIFADQ
jgi:hypothetical protein